MGVITLSPSFPTKDRRYIKVLLLHAEGMTGTIISWQSSPVKLRQPLNIVFKAESITNQS